MCLFVGNQGTYRYGRDDNGSGLALEYQRFQYLNVVIDIRKAAKIGLLKTHMLFPWCIPSIQVDILE